MNKQKNAVVNVILPSLAAVIITVCSWIYIPFTVPFTLQTFAIFLIVSLFGPKISLISITVYILLGIIGLPVFSGFNSGAGVLSGPTGGYIIGFLIIPIIYAVFTKFFSKSYWGELSGLFLGLMLCYTIGTIWFMFVYNKSGNIGFLKTLSLCVIPFIIPDLIKLGLALFISYKTKPKLEKIRID